MSISKKTLKKGKGSKSLEGVSINLTKKVNSDYTMMDDIKKCALYGKSKARDTMARDYLDYNAPLATANDIVPGQMIVFDYFEPKNRDELEYYDASPCTIFFNVVQCQEGPRVLGFNIHYFPPKMRYIILDRIFDTFRPIYKNYFTGNQDREIDQFNYLTLLEELDKAGLGFGVRMYIPELMVRVKYVPVNMWKVAVFTEGFFKKATRTAIMRYWEQWANTHKDPLKRYKRKHRKKTKKKTI